MAAPANNTALKVTTDFQIDTLVEKIMACKTQQAIKEIVDSLKTQSSPQLKTLQATAKQLKNNGVVPCETFAVNIPDLIGLVLDFQEMQRLGNEIAILMGSDLDAALAKTYASLSGHYRNVMLGLIAHQYLEKGAMAEAQTILGEMTESDEKKKLVVAIHFRQNLGKKTATTAASK